MKKPWNGSPCSVATAYNLLAVQLETANQLTLDLLLPREERKPAMKASWLCLMTLVYVKTGGPMPWRSLTLPVRCPQCGSPRRFKTLQLAAWRENSNFCGFLWAADLRWLERSAGAYVFNNRFYWVIITHMSDTIPIPKIHNTMLSILFHSPSSKNDATKRFIKKGNQPGNHNDPNLNKDISATLAKPQCKILLLVGCPFAKLFL